MDFRKTEPSVSEALADPIVKALMAADRIDPKDVEDLMRRTAARLAQPGPQDGSALQTRREKPVASTGLAMLAKDFVFAVAVIMGLSAAPRPAAADEAPVAFISALGTQALAVIRSDMPLASKAAYFGRLVRQDFDVNGICRFVLGPYWPVASPAERQELCNGFADRLVDFYGRHLAQSGDGNFVTTGSRAHPDGVIVTSRIIPEQGAPIALDWRLGIRAGSYKIEDVDIDGVSMVSTQRSEMTALIAREGGEVGTLLAVMR